MEKPISNLSRTDWIDFALQKLSKGGIDKVTVAALARDLGVTKGSFYWHFKDREHLLKAMLNRWEETGSRVVFNEVERVGGNAKSRLKHMSNFIFKRYGDQLNFELALREWGRKDPEIQHTIAQEDERRMDYLKGLFSEAYDNPKIAEAKAWLMYSLFIGETMIASPVKEQTRENLLWICLESLLESKELTT